MCLVGQPFVLTYPNNSGAGTVNVNQLWGADTGILK